MLKYKPHYDLESKMSWYSDFKSFTENLLSLQLRGKRHKITDSENKAKMNKAKLQ